MLLDVPPAELARHAGLKEETLRKISRGYSKASANVMQSLRTAAELWRARNALKPGDLKLEEAPQKRLAPVVSWASAGFGGAYDDLANQIEEWVETVSRDPNKYALIVDGDSMSPKYEPGDRIVVEPNSEAQNGDVVVARLSESGEVFFKLYHEVEKGRVRLSSYNPLFPPIQREKIEFRFIHPVVELKRFTRRR